eukprot:2707784-Rhodomonas_salina.1
MGVIFVPFGSVCAASFAASDVNTVSANAYPIAYRSSAATNASISPGLRAPASCPLPRRRQPRALCAQRAVEEEEERRQGACLCLPQGAVVEQRRPRREPEVAQLDLFPPDQQQRCELSSCGV